MIAQVAFVDCTPDQAEDAARRIRSEEGSGGAERAGFRGRLFLLDRERNQVIMVSLWDSDEARAADAARWPPHTIGIFEQIGVRRREARIFEVLPDWSAPRIMEESLPQP